MAPRQTATKQRTTASPPLQPERPKVPMSVAEPTGVNRSLIPAGGGVTFTPQSLNEVVSFAKIMADSGNMIPKQFRGNIGACAAITLKALHWGLSPFDVASEAYIATKPDADGNYEGIIAYGAKLIHAVINTRSGIQEPLEVVYDGDDGSLKATVTGILGGKKRTYDSPMVSNIKVKNSPLWAADTKQQLHYYAVRAWARRWCPEVLLGAYTREEIESGNTITDADRIAAIDHEAPRDVLDDDPISDDDEPISTAPLAARMSYQLEKCGNKDECNAVYMKLQNEIGTKPESEREPLRDLYAMHLRRVLGKVPVEEAMEYSRGFRQQETT
jgi:RecT family